jgi:EmrB/QacA subfamily drug resistance transporter
MKTNTNTHAESTVVPIPTAVYARRWKTLAVLSLSLLIIGLDNTILNVALPSLQDQLGAEGSSLQWIVDSYLLVFAGLLLTLGAFGDRFGRKLALQLGVAIFGLASMAVVFVDSPNQLIGVRSVMGIGGALIMPATLSIISNVFPREERAKAIGVWAGVAAAGIGLGPLAGGLLLEWFSWKSVFFVNVPITALAFLLAIKLVPESRDPKPGAFDPLGAVLSVVSLTTLVYTVIEAPDNGWLSPFTLAGFGVFALLAVLFIAWESRVAEPMLNLSYFRKPRFGIGSIAISFAFFGLMGASYVLTQYLQSAHGYSALEAGAAQVPLALGLLVGNFQGTKLAARFGARAVVAAGLLGVAVHLAMSLTWTSSTPYWQLGPWFLGIATFIGYVTSPATDSVMGAVPEAKAGVASAMNDVTRQVAGALGVAILGSIVSSIYSSRVAEDTAGLPTAAAESAQDSIGGAVAVSDTLPAAQGSALNDAAGAAFTHALGIGFMVAAGVALAGMAIVAKFLPPRHEPRDAQEDVHIEAEALPVAA